MATWRLMVPGKPGWHVFDGGRLLGFSPFWRWRRRHLLVACSVPVSLVFCESGMCGVVFFVDTGFHFQGSFFNYYCMCKKWCF